MPSTTLCVSLALLSGVGRWVTLTAVVLPQIGQYGSNSWYVKVFIIHNICTIISAVPDCFVYILVRENSRISVVTANMIVLPRGLLSLHTESEC